MRTASPVPGWCAEATSTGRTSFRPGSTRAPAPSRPARFGPCHCPSLAPRSRAIVEEDYAQKSYTTRTEKVAEIDTFVNRCSRGRPRGHQLGARPLRRHRHGRPHLAQEPGRPVQRAAHCACGTTSTKPIDYSAIPKSVSAKLSSQHTIVDLTSDLAALRSLLEEDSAPKTSKPVTPPVVEELSLRPVDRRLRGGPARRCRLAPVVRGPAGGPAAADLLRAARHRQDVPRPGDRHST